MERFVWLEGGCVLAFVRVIGCRDVRKNVMVPVMLGIRVGHQAFIIFIIDKGIG